jgi:hypothetical protein
MPGGTAEIHGKAPAGQTVSWPRFEYCAFPIKVRSDSLVPICSIYATYLTSLQQQRKVIPQLKWLVASLPKWWPEFDPRSDHVRFVDKVALQLV